MEGVLQQRFPRQLHDARGGETRRRDGGVDLCRRWGDPRKTRGRQGAEDGRGSFRVDSDANPARDREPNDQDRELSEDDWLLGVDGMRGAVWLFEVGDEGLEGLFKDAPSLSKWLERTAGKVAKVVGRAPKPGATPKQPQDASAGTPTLQSPAVLCLKFLLDRKQIELAEGASVAELAARITPLLSLKPPKRAVRAVLDLLAEDAAVDEVFADDDLLAKIVIEFVD